jgi:hypothetical protein
LAVYYFYYTLGIITEQQFYKMASSFGYEVGNAGDEPKRGRPVPDSNEL